MVKKSTDGKWSRMPGYGGGGKVLHLCLVDDERRYLCREPRAWNSNNIYTIRNI